MLSSRVATTVEERSLFDAVDAASDHVADAANLSCAIAPEGVDKDRFIVIVAASALVKVIEDMELAERCSAIEVALVILNTVSPT